MLQSFSPPSYETLAAKYAVGDVSRQAFRYWLSWGHRFLMLGVAGELCIALSSSLVLRFCCSYVLHSSDYCCTRYAYCNHKSTVP